MRHSRDGGMLVNAKIFSLDGRIVADIENNEFHINPNNYFRQERPDNHRLIVYDQQGVAVLNVHYLNRKAVRILGTFLRPGYEPVVVREDSVHCGRLHISGPTAVGNKNGRPLLQIGS